MHDVFLSYSSKNKAAADAACNVLERNGVRVWLAPRDIMPGMGWAKSIIGGIAGARVVVLIFSSHANASSQVEREVERAINKGIPIVPFRVEDVQPKEALEYFISSRHWLDAFTPPIEQHFERLVLAVKHLLASGYVKAREDQPPQRDETADQPAGEPMIFVDRPHQRREASDAALRAIQEESVLVALSATLPTQPLVEASQPKSADGLPTERQIAATSKPERKRNDTEVRLDKIHENRSQNRNLTLFKHIKSLSTKRLIVGVLVPLIFFIILFLYLYENLSETDAIPMISQLRPSPEEVVRDLVAMEACTMAWNHHVQDLIDEGKELSTTEINEPTGRPFELSGMTGNKYMYTANNRLSICGWYFIPSGSDSNNYVAKLASLAQVEIISETMGTIDIAAQDIYAASPNFRVSDPNGRSLNIDFEEHFREAVQFYKNASANKLKPIENLEGGRAVVDNSMPITYAPRSEILDRQNTEIATKTAKDLKNFDQFLDRTKSY